MVGIVSGNEQGLLTGSLTLLNGGGAVGQANLGRQGEQVYLNAATGNLVIQNRDELLINQGLDAALVRTYNSQGQFTDDNGDNFRIGFNKRLINLPATPNTTGTSITRINADGSESLYSYDETQGVYITSDGSGADDTLAFSGGSWTWTEGSSRITETYDANGQLQNSRDADGNTTTYNYDASGRLTQVNDASGQSVNLIYTGINLTSIQTVTPEGAQTRVRYGYDTSNRLTQVTVDLTPEDSSIADGNTYVTTYTYDGSSKRIASITQGDGNTISFTYDASGRVATYTDGVGRTTTVDYTSLNEDVVEKAIANSSVLESTISTNFGLNSSRLSTTDTVSTTTNYSLNRSALSTTDTETVTTNHNLNNGVLSTTDTVTESLTVTASNSSKTQSSTVRNFAYARSGTNLVTRSGVSLAAGVANIGDTTPTQVKATLYRSDGSFYGTTLTDVGFIQQGYYIGASSTFNTATESTVTTPAHFSTQFSNESLGRARKHIPVNNFNGQINLSLSTLPADTYRVVIEVRDDAAAGWSFNNQLIDERDGTYVRTTQVFVTVGTDLNPTTLTVPAGTRPTGVSSATVQYRVAGSSAAFSTATLNLSNNTANLGDLPAGNYEYVVRYRNSAGTVLKTVTGTTSVGIGGNRTSTGSANATVTTAPYYDVKSGDSFNSIAQKLYGTSLVGDELRTALGNPSLTAGRHLTNLPTRLSNTVNNTITVAPHYDVKAGDTYSSIAQRLYGSSLVGDELQAALNNISLTVNKRLTVFPASLNNTAESTISVPPYYTVKAGDTFESIALALYGSSVVSDELQVALNNPVLTAGTRITDFAASLTNTVSVTPFYTVQAGDTFESIAVAVYGNSQVASALQAALGNPNLVAGQRLTLPGSLDYISGRQTLDSTNITNANGAVTSYTYDGEGRLVRVGAPSVSGQSAITRYRYDENDNVIETIDGLRNSVDYAYDANGNQVLQRDSEGNTVTRSFSADNQLLTETVYTGIDTDGVGPALPSGAQTSRYVYDSESHLRFAVSAEGRVSEYRYDVAGNQIAAIIYTGNAYNLSGLSATDTLNETDLLGFVASADKTKNQRVDSEYDFRGQLRSTKTYTDVDVNGNGIVNAQTSTTQFIYDAFGQLTQTIDGNGNQSEFIYDGLNRLTLSTGADGEQTLTVYDDVNYTIATTVANGLTTTSVYNIAGELVSVIQDDSITGVQLGTTTYHYDAAENLRHSIDPTGRHSYQLYDARNRVVAEIDADGSLSERIYDENNNLVQSIAYATRINTAQLVNANSSPADVSLDAIRPAANTKDRTFNTLYDTSGRPVLSFDSVGAVTQTLNDGVGRVTDVIQYANTINVSGLSAQSRPEDVIARIQSSADDRHSRTFYDAEGNVTGQLDAAGYLLETRYDDAGQPVRTIAYANAASQSVRQNGSFNAVKSSIPASSKDINAHTLYNARGEITATVDGEGFLVENTYDAAGNITKIIAYANKRAFTQGSSLSSVRPASSSQDQVTTFTYTVLNQLESSTNNEGTVTRYTYDEVGNLVETTVVDETANNRLVTVSASADTSELISEISTFDTTTYTLDRSQLTTTIGGASSFYEVQDGDTFAGLAQSLFGNAELANELETALGSITLTAGQILTNLPDSLVNNDAIGTQAVTPFYTVKRGDSYATIANTVYGNAATAQALQRHFANAPLSEGDSLEVPLTLDYDVPQTANADTAQLTSTRSTDFRLETAALSTTRSADFNIDNSALATTRTQISTVDFTLDATQLDTFEPVAAPPTEVALTNLSGARGAELRYTFEVPEGASQASFKIAGGFGDADIYIKHGSAPTLSSFDFRPYIGGNNETVTISAPQAGTYHIAVIGYSSFTGVNLTSTYSTAPVATNSLLNNVPETNLSGARGDQLDYKIEVPEGATNLQFQISGGFGDADLYVKYGSAPTLSSFDFRPYIGGNFETVNVPAPRAGTYYVSLVGYFSFSGVSLNTSYDFAGNEAPVVSAGIEQTVSASSPVTLTGTGVDVDGTVVAYSWRQISGPSVRLTNPNNATSSFTAPIVGAVSTLEFELTAIDNEGAISKDIVTVTVEPSGQTYTVQAGDSFASIAQALYGTTGLAGELRAALGNPVLTAGAVLTGFPDVLTDTVTTTVSVPPYYTVKTGDTFTSIAEAIYGTRDVADELQVALGNPRLSAGVELTNFPSILTNTFTVAPYYQVQNGDTFASIAQALYGTADVADELQAALGNPTLVAGSDLTGLPTTLTNTITVTPFYTVQAGDTYRSIASRIYGTALATTALQDFYRGAALTAGEELTLPLVLDYTVTNTASADTQILTSEIEVFDSTRYALDATQLTPVTPYYTVTNVDTVASIAQKLYGNADLDNEFRLSLLGGSLFEGLRLDENQLPAALANNDAISTEAVTPFYTVRANDTYSSIAQRVYGDVRAAGVLQAAFDGLELSEGDTLEVPLSLNYQVPDVLSNNRTLTTEYDVQGRVVAELTPEGSLALDGASTQSEIDAVWDRYAVQYTYDAVGRRISSSDQNNNTTLLYYNADGQLSHSVNARGEVIRTTYNAFGEVEQILQYANRIDTSGLTGGEISSTLTSRLAAARDVSRDTLTKTEYTVRGAVSRITDALGDTTTSTYNAFGQLSTVRDAEGVLSRFGYSTRGLSNLNITDVGGFSRTTRQVYDAFGRVIASTDPRGNVSQATYDRRGQVVETRDALNGRVRSSYDAFGRILTVSDPLGQVTRYQYDQNQRSVVITSPEGNQTTTVRNRFGEDVVVTDGNGNATTFSYNHNGELTSVQDASGNLAQSLYDEAGLTTESTDARGVKTIYRYDATNRLVSTTLDPDGLALTTSFKYNTKGQTILTTDPAGLVTRTRYDAKGQQVSVSVDPDGLNLTTEYSYDRVGQLLTVTNGAGTSEAVVTRYQYDDLGRQTEERIDPAGLSLSTKFSYDASDNVIRTTDANGDVTRYVYDANDRLVFTIDALGGVSKNLYDAAGKVTQAIRYASEVNVSRLPATLTVANVTGLIASDSTQDRIESAIYDKDGRLVYQRDSLGNITEFVYDAAGNIIKDVAYASPVASSTSNTVSGIRNALVANRSQDRVNYNVYNSLNQVVYNVDVFGAVTEYTYDANGNVTNTTLYARAINPALADRSNALSAVRSALVSRADASQDRSVRSVFDAANREVYTIDAAGFAVKTNYDAVGRVSGTVTYSKALDVSATPGLAEVNAARDREDPDNRVSRIVYDAAGRVVSNTDSEGFTETNQYDAVGNNIAYTNAKGDTFTYEYDAVGRLVKELTPVVSVARLNETNSGVVNTVENRQRLVTQITYDALGNVLSRTEAAGTSQERTTRYEYDALSRQIKTIFPQVGVYNASSDRAAGFAGRNESTITPTATTQFDAFGNAVIHQYVNGNYSYKVYDQQGRLKFDVDTEGYVIGYNYDAFGNQSELTRFGKAVSITPGSLPDNFNPDDLEDIINNAQPQVTVTNEVTTANITPNQPFSYVGSATSDTEIFVNSTGVVTVTPTTESQSSNVQNFAYQRDGDSLVTVPGLSLAPGSVAIGDTTPTQVKATLYRSNGDFFATTFTDVGHIQQGFYFGTTNVFNEALGVNVTVPAHFEATTESTGIANEDALGAARKHIPVTNFTGQVNLSTGVLPPDTYRVVVEVRDDAAETWTFDNQLIDERDGTYVRTTELFVTVGTVITAATLSIPKSEQPAGTTLSVQYRAAGSAGLYTSVEVAGNATNNTAVISGEQPGNYEYLLQYRDTFGQVVQSGTGTFSINGNNSSVSTSYVTPVRSSSVTTGSSIRGYISAAQASAVDSFTAIVRNADSGQIVSTATTYPGAISNYAGQVNLSVGSVLPDGRYTVEITQNNRNGTQSVNTFDYEVGAQNSDALVSTLLFRNDDKPEGTIPEVRFAPVGSPDFVVAPGEETLDGYEVILTNANLGVYNFILQYVDSSSNVVSSIAGSFEVTAGGTTTEGGDPILIDPRIGGEIPLGSEFPIDGIPDPTPVEPIVTQSRTVITEYDQRGQIARVITPSTFNFDSSVTSGGAYFESEGITANSYNAAGQITKQSTLKNPVTNTYINSYFYYDTRGNQVANIDALGYLTEYKYDANGNVVEIKEYAKALSENNYNEAGYTGVVSTTPQNSPGSALGYDRVTQIGYDKLDQKITETRVNVEFSDATYGGTVNITTEFGDLTTRYSYDAVGNQVSVTDATGATSFTYYDALGRVIAAAKPARLSEDASGGSLPTISVENGILSLDKPRVGNTQVSLRFAVAGTGNFTNASLIDKGDHFEVNVAALSNDYYDYRLEFTRFGETTPYARGTGQFTITGQSSVASQHVVAKALEPTVSLANIANARVVNDEDGTYYSGSTRINVDYTSLADIGEGAVRVSAFYAVQNAFGNSTTRTISDTFNDGSTRASLLVGNSSDPRSLQTVTNVTRIIVEKNTGSGFVTVHDSAGDSVAAERLVLQGKTAGLTGINVAGVGFLAATSLGDGLFSVNINGLARGNYTFTPVGTTSNVSGSFEARGTGGGLAVQEGYHAYTQSTTDPATLNDEDGSFFGGPGSINLSYASLEQYGGGNVRIVVDYTASDANNRTVNRSRTVTLSAADAIDGTRISVNDGFNRVTTINHVQIFKVIDGVEVQLHDRRSNSNSGQIEISGLPSGASNVTFEYRVAGDNSPFLTKTTSSIGTGWFAVGYDDLVNNNYEYRVTVRNSAGNPVNLTALGGNANGTLTGVLSISRGADSLTTLTSGDINTLTPLTTIKHDAFGNAIKVTNHANSAVSAVRQDLATDGNEGFVAGGVNSNDQHTYTFFDTFGNAIKEVDAEGSVVNTSYNADGTIAKTWQTLTDIDGNTRQITTLFEYDNLGQQTSTTQVLQGGVLASEEVEYNAHGEIVTKGLNGTIQEYYQYDNSGRIIRTNEETGIDRAFLYDLSGQATAEISSTEFDLSDDTYASSAYIASLTDGVQRRESVFDNLGRVVEQRQPSFVSTNASNSISAAITFESGVLSFDKPAVAGTVATFRYALLGSNNLVTANVVDKGDHYEVALPNLANDYYSYTLAFNRSGDPTPYASGAGEFTVTGQSSSGSRHVVGVALEPTSSLQSFESARIVDDESGRTYVGTSRINVAYSSLEDLGQGNVVVTAFYTAKNVFNQTRNASVAQQFSDTSTGGSLVVGSSQNPSSYQTITSVNRILIQKNVGNQLITVHDSAGDRVSPEVLLLQGNTNGLTSINISGVGRREVTSIGAGFYTVNVGGLARGTYTFTPVGTASTVAGTFEVKGTGGGLVVQEGHHTFTQTISNPTELSDESGTRFSGLGKINIAYSSLEQYGNGNVRVVVNYTVKNGRGQTTTTSQTASLNAADGLTGTSFTVGTSTNISSFNQVTSVNKVTVYKVIDGAEVVIHDRTGSSNSGRLEISGIPSSANTVTFEYRREGDVTSNFLSKTSSKLGGSFYGVGYDELPEGRYEYRVTVRNAAGDAINLSGLGGTANGVFTGVVEITRGGDTAVPVNVGDSIEITPTITQTLDRYGNVLSVTDPRNTSFTSLYRYDYANNVIEERLPVSEAFNEQAVSANVRPTTNYAYDKAGRQISTTDANGHTTGQRFDAAGQLVGEYSATGGITTHTYNSLGQRIATVDANRNITSYTYDRNDRAISQSTPELTENYIYDEVGNRIRVSNAKGENTDTFYDTRGNVISTRLAEGQRSFSSYDLRNNKIEDKDANGKTITRDVDYFGRVNSFVDLGGVETRYTYNFNGQAVTQENDRGQDISFQYYGNGQLQRIVDNALASETYYAYDAAGNTIQERYTEQGVVYQDARSSYDALGRVTEVQDNEFTLNYGYDAVGNRRFTKTRYFDSAGNQQVNNNYYLYDDANRITLSRGVLNGTSIEIDRNQGVELEYDAAGNRRVARFFEGNSIVEESYLYDGNNRLVSTNRAGLLTSSREYDNAGRVIEYSTFSNPGQLNERKVSTYNKNGQLLRQDIFDATRQVAILDYNQPGSYDAAGNVLKYSLETIVGTRTKNTYTYSYLEQESYKESRVSGSRTINFETGAATSTGSTTNAYDVNGNLISVVDAQDGAKNQTFVNNFQGQILRKTQDGKVQNYYYAEGRAIGSQGEISDADFDYNYTPVNESYPATTPGAYVVSDGDTLQSISLAVYGDASLWYIIADANGLRSDSDLVSGQTLRIPNTITNINNNSDTFRPYNAGEVIGDTTPTLPDPPPPPAKDKCGGFGAILVIIVTVVVAIYAPQLLGVTSELGIAVVGAAAGNIAGQITANLAGLQDGFDFGSFASSVLTAGLTSGVGTEFFTGLEGIEVVAVNNLIGQGVRVITGQQDGFDFKSFATSVISAPISASIGNSLRGENYQPGADFLKDFSINFAQGAATELVRVAVNGGGKFEFASVAANSFGIALGNSLVYEPQISRVSESIAAANSKPAEASIQKPRTSVTGETSSLSNDELVNPVPVGGLSTNTSLFEDVVQVDQPNVVTDSSIIEQFNGAPNTNIRPVDRPLSTGFEAFSDDELDSLFDIAVFHEEVLNNAGPFRLHENGAVSLINSVSDQLKQATVLLGNRFDIDQPNTTELEIINFLKERNRLLAEQVVNGSPESDAGAVNDIIDQASGFSRGALIEPDGKFSRLAFNPDVIALELDRDDQSTFLLAKINNARTLREFLEFDFRNDDLDTLPNLYLDNTTVVRTPFLRASLQTGAIGDFQAGLNVFNIGITRFENFLSDLSGNNGVELQVGASADLVALVSLFDKVGNNATINEGDLNGAQDVLTELLIQNANDNRSFAAGKFSGSVLTGAAPKFLNSKRIQNIEGISKLNKFISSKGQNIAGGIALLAAPSTIGNTLNTIKNARINNIDLSFEQIIQSGLRPNQFNIGAR